MIIGYARTSTFHQQYGLEDQIQKLESVGCEKIFSEQVSSAVERPELDNAMNFVREGDVFVVTNISRFSRSITDMWKRIEFLENKNVDFKILDVGVDTTTPSGRLVLSVLSAVYQFEREMLLERQMIGIQKAKEEGKFLGRVPTAKRQADEIKRLHELGLKPHQIAKTLDIGVASVYRYR